MIQQKLLKRRAAGTPIKVGWVGAGRMITGAICQTALMKGIRNAVICDIRPEVAIRAYEINGIPKPEIVFSEHVGTINDALRAGKPVITQNSHLMPTRSRPGGGTGVPSGGGVAYRCIQGQAHHHAERRGGRGDRPILHQRRSGYVSRLLRRRTGPDHQTGGPLGA
jgi:hypothetical protein